MGARWLVHVRVCEVCACGLLALGHMGLSSSASCKYIWSRLTSDGRVRQVFAACCMSIVRAVVGLKGKEELGSQASSRSPKIARTSRAEA